MRIAWHSALEGVGSAGPHAARLHIADTQLFITCGQLKAAVSPVPEVGVAQQADVDQISRQGSFHVALCSIKQPVVIRKVLLLGQIYSKMQMCTHNLASALHDSKYPNECPSTESSRPADNWQRSAAISALATVEFYESTWSCGQA